MYGYDVPEESCWYRDSGKEYNIIWQWVTFFGWVDVSILYCAIVIIMVIRKLRSFSTSHLSSHPTLINKTVISSVVRKVVWYPVVPLLVQFCNSFVETYAYVNRLLNALVFSQDIAVIRAFQAVKLHLWISNVNSYESNYPHRSHNKAIIDEFTVLGKSNDFIDLKDNLKQDINIFDNQNDDQNTHLVLPEPAYFQSSSLELSSNGLNPSTSSDPLIGGSQTNQCNANNIHNSLNSNTNAIDISVGNDEERIDIMLNNGNSTNRLSEEFVKIFNSDIGLSQEIELILKRL
ncbi:27500_t:CDS:2 [Gigaspora margarita]|uniref:27500_t:CDS:1 n=1 Tax=Gigaspora margarita TaxID=4874 RepID=A0ABN7UHP1_GIGMA|nr:27500_t:CDS:2 [Gigaspora margarita]